MTKNRANNRPVHEWLSLWGAWERAGGGYLSHLYINSNMQIVMRDNVQQETHGEIMLNEDDESWFCDLISRVKRNNPAGYELLFRVEVLQWSMREIARREKCSFEQCARNYENVVGYVDGMLSFAKELGCIKKQAVR